MKRILISILIISSFTSIYCQRQDFNREKDILSGTKDVFYLGEFVYIPTFLKESKPKTVIIKTFVTVERKLPNGNILYYKGIADSSIYEYKENCISTYICYFDTNRVINYYEKKNKCYINNIHEEKEIIYEEKRVMKDNYIGYDTLVKKVKKYENGTLEKLYGNYLQSFYSYNSDTLIEYIHSKNNNLPEINKYLLDKRGNVKVFLGYHKTKLYFENKFSYDEKGKLLKVDKYTYTEDTTHNSTINKYNKLGFLISTESRYQNTIVAYCTIEYKLNKNNDWEEITFTTILYPNNDKEIRTMKKF